MTDNNARWTILSLYIDRFIGYIPFAGRGHQKIIQVMMLIKITGTSVKFIGSKTVYSREPYEYELTAVRINDT